MSKYFDLFAEKSKAEDKMTSLDQELLRLSGYAITREWTKYLLQLYSIANKYKFFDERFSNHFLVASLLENFDQATQWWKTDSSMLKIGGDIKENNIDEIATLKSKIDFDYDSEDLPENCFTLIIGNHNLPKGRWKLPNERTFLWSLFNKPALTIDKFVKPIYKEGFSPQGNRLVLLQSASKNLDETDTISEEITKYYILKRLKHYDVNKTIMILDTESLENTKILSPKFYKDLIIEIIQNLLDSQLTFDKLNIISDDNNQKKYLKSFINELYEFITFNSDLENKLEKLIIKSGLKVSKEKKRFISNLEVPDEPYVNFRKMFSPNCSKLDSSFEHLYKIKDTAASILLLGESGVGKGVLAELIHNQSNRRNVKNGFQAFNCASGTKELIESRLFGYERGAFTDAKEMRKGLFELADKGTLFLDEIGDATHEVQSALLKVIEDKKIRRISGKEDIIVDVRIIFATNQDLKNLVTERRFREDLYFRINNNTINIPPLRERLEDIPYIVDLRKAEYEKTNKTKLQISETFIKSLEKIKWSGNVREIIHFIDEIFILAPGNDIKTIDDKLVIQQLGSFENKILDFNLTEYEDSTLEFFKSWLSRRDKITKDLKSQPELQYEDDKSNQLSFGRSVIEPILANIFIKNRKLLGIRTQTMAGETIGLTWGAKSGTLLQKHKLYPIIEKHFKQG